MDVDMAEDVDNAQTHELRAASVGISSSSFWGLVELRMCADLPLGARPPSPPPALRSQEELEHAAAVEAFVKRSAYMASLNQRVRRGPAS